ncbi:MAG: hypothetical protein JWM58_4602 [Rhizobium sp.]|nr:hypothetical protein [Rhizobium sp.]
MSALLLRDGEFVACVYRGLVDDYAQRAVKIVAQKVFKSTRKKFSKLMFNVYERKISAWDYYCYGLYKGDSAFRDKFVYDFIRLATMRQIDAIPEEKRRLIEISACDFQDIDRNTVLNRETVFELVQSQIHTLVLAHGRSLQQIYTAGNLTGHQAITNGASPA